MKPQIIRTRDELADLDRETLVAPAYQFGAGGHRFAQRHCYIAADAHRLDLTWSGPMVVIATGDQVRAARQALEETPTGDFHSSIGLFQQLPSTWEEA